MSRRALFFPIFVLVLAGCPETNPDDFPVPPVPCADFSTPQGYVDALKCSDYQSCALSCTCSEPAKPYQCPAMQPWSAMSHGQCGTYDGSTLPMVVAGSCAANAPTLDALRSIGLDPGTANRWHLPDGHWISPAGHDQIIHGADITSAFLADMILVPQTHFAIAVDAGVDDNALYSVDLDLLAADTAALVSDVRFASPAELDYGIAFTAPNEVWVSGAGNGKLYAFTIDTTSGALARDMAKDVDLGAGWYAGGISTTSDPDKMFVAPSTGESQARLVDLGAQTWSSIDVSPAHELFGVFQDPNDVSQNTYWLTTYDTRELLRVDLGSMKVGARFGTGKNPEGIAITAAHVIVANSDDDTLEVYDTSGNVVQTLDVKLNELGGAQPSVLAYDASSNRIYAALSGINAIGVYDYASSSSAPLTAVGQIPTSWWPTAIRLRTDGTLVIASAKGHGTGPATATLTTPSLTKGAIALLSPPSDSDLVAMTTTVAASRATSQGDGFPTVTCPQNSVSDFPIPITNTGSSSPRIDHVVYVVRASKTFDSLFGDLPNVDGDPQNVLAPGRMDEIFANTRALAQQFTNFDDYGTAADESLQGHVWSVYGRSTDYIERVWSSTSGRAVRAPLTSTYGAPGEGSLFIWAERNGISYEDMGEPVGVGAQGIDPNYPGGAFDLGTPDTNKACYIAAHARALCDLSSLTYVGLPDDETFGAEPGKPSASIMLAVNDVATGMIADALSHSPLWETTLLIVTDDDPAMGADHVDAHRTPLFMISPWVKRGYVSHTKLGTAAIHKMLAHIFAKPYQSESVADAAIPFDAFTSTPDFTPYTFSPLKTDVSCNPSK